MKRTVLVLALSCLAAAPAGAADLRVGIIGLDTSHVVAFTKSLNDPASPDHVAGGRVVAAFKGGSPDVPASASRVDKFTADLQSTYGIRIVPTIAELCDLVDVVLLESVDGRVHLAQAREVLRRGKRLFIDKPMAASFADAKELARLAKESGTPWFSASSLRFAPEYQAFLADPAHDRVLGVEAHGPASLEPTNPGLFWYGIHTVETLFTLMGPGCVSVSMTSSADFDLAVGTWRDGRIGSVKGLRKGNPDYGALVYGEKAVVHLAVKEVSYVALVRQIMDFFRTGTSPVPPDETLEIMAFMDAAERSRSNGGVATALPR
jgi:predicted dehydrogenase